jgi:DNA-binding transcriptional LysR family regulator
MKTSIALKANHMRPTFLSTPLRYFLVVAQLGSVSAAAEQLHVAASAISRQLTKLEGSLGLALFERKQRGMALTSAGLQLAAQLRSAAEEVDRLIDQVQGVVQQRNQQVRVACTEGFAPGFMPGVMNHFRQQVPDVQFRLIVAHPREVTSLVLRGQVDMAIKYSVAPERGLHAHLSVLAPVQAIMRPDHPLARRRQLRVADVVRYPLVMPTTGNTGRDLFDLSCSIQGLHYRVKVESNFSSALLSLVIDKDLLLAGELTVSHLLKSGNMVAVPFADGEMQQRRLQLLTAEGVVASPVVQAFIDCVQAEIQSGKT